MLGCASSSERTNSSQAGAGQSGTNQSGTGQGGAGNNQGGTTQRTVALGGSSQAGASQSSATAGGTNSGGATASGGGTLAGGNASGGALGGNASGGALGGGRPNGGAGTSSAGRGNGGIPNAGQPNSGTSGGKASGGQANGGVGNAGSSGVLNGGAAGSSQPVGGQNTAGATPGVRIVGRTAPASNGAMRFQWSGVSIQARFRGTQVSIQLQDGGNQNEFTVVIDGVVRPNLVTASGKTSYQLATGLTDATHDLLVWRRTEAYYNPTDFVALSDFGTGGGLLAPPPAPERRIEVIGDSITCGYGNEGSPGCSGTKPENNYLAYASVAARSLGADLHTVAWSGIGMYRNYGENGPSTDTMPTRYDLALPTVAGSTWDFNKFLPHAVVINLGTNDFSTKGDPGQPYIDAYIKFVQHLRSVYPLAYIFCLIPVTEATSDINQVVSTLKSAGETRIEAFDINVTAGASGCDGHPDVAKHKAMGDKLAAEIKRVLAW